MKKLFLLLTLSIFVFTFSFAQTKKIAHASHSGKKSELRYERDGNFGNPPNMIHYEPDPSIAIMHHYADSIRKADSLAQVVRRMDSIHTADSIQKANQVKQPKKSGKKPKATHGATAILKPKDAAIGFQ